MIKLQLSTNKIKLVSFSEKSSPSNNFHKKKTYTPIKTIVRKPSTKENLISVAMQAFVSSQNFPGDFNNMSELAAIILSRTQLRKGFPELALELLINYKNQYGSSEIIENEISKLQEVLVCRNV
ncbi:MAG: hypothetical protein R3B45_07045 [Bdellovibrionota bacterium]